MKYISRKETSTTRGRYRKIHTADPGFSEDAAMAARMVSDTKAFARGSCAHVGHVMLALAALALKSLDLLPEKVSAVTAKAANDAAAVLSEVTGDVTLQDTRRAMLLIAAACRRMDNPLDLKTNHQWALWNFGYEGHPMTRETAQKLGIIRRFENVSTEFAVLMHRTWIRTVQQGVAITAWSDRLPILICDLTNPLHEEMADAMFRAGDHEVMIVSKNIPPSSRQRWWQYRHHLVEDHLQFMTGIFGAGGGVALIERRLEGWTVTFPTGVITVESLKDKKIPKHWRLFARCTEMQARLATQKAGSGVSGEAKTDLAPQDAVPPLAAAKDAA